MGRERAKVRKLEGYRSSEVGKGAGERREQRKREGSNDAIYALRKYAASLRDPNSKP